MYKFWINHISFQTIQFQKFQANSNSTLSNKLKVLGVLNIVRCRNRRVIE